MVLNSSRNIEREHSKQFIIISSLKSKYPEVKSTKNNRRESLNKMKTEDESKTGERDLRCNVNLFCSNCHSLYLDCIKDSPCDKGNP